MSACACARARCRNCARCAFAPWAVIRYRAVESSAASVTEIIQEMLLARTSERQGRIIDHDGAASMERKKQEGYF